MDAFWLWFYDQLERKPEEKEQELLKSALEETMQAAPGTEPLASARLLQTRIGNHAMQQLMQMKYMELRAREQQQEALADERSMTAEPKTHSQEAGAPPEEAPRTPADVVNTEPTEQLEPKQPVPVQEVFEADGLMATPAAEPTGEAELAAALSAFMPTLRRGGGIREWDRLTRLFGEASPLAREDVLHAITAIFHSLAQSAQSLFMKKLMRWQHDNDELAALLWLRLSPSMHAGAEMSEGDGNGGNGDNA